MRTCLKWSESVVAFEFSFNYSFNYLATNEIAQLLHHNKSTRLIVHVALIGMHLGRIDVDLQRQLDGFLKESHDGVDLDASGLQVVFGTQAQCVFQVVTNLRRIAALQLQILQKDIWLKL